jgi:4-alpha-glucanotransferase
MKRGCGILLPVFSLPSAHGIGDFGPSAHSFADQLSEHGIAYWQILPLNAGNPENGESPYFSASAFAINPLLISLEKLSEAGLLISAEIASLPIMPVAAIEYEAVRRAKLPLLNKAVTRFQSTPDFEEFQRVNAFWLDDFALFEAMHTMFDKPWSDWPAAIRDRKAEECTMRTRHHTLAIIACQVLQYLAWTQWRELHRYCTERGITIIGDMPIYVAHDSADTWAHRGLFKLDKGRRPRAVSGVPPDYFSATGQLWNNPVYDWAAHQTEGFTWWTGRMRHLFALYDIVRIDHFRGLVHYWEIPAGEKNAIRGSWKDVPTYDLFDKLRAACQPFPVISEDLGIITDDVRSAMQHYGFPGMKILQFAFSDDNPDHPYLPHTYDANCLVYTGTHDNLPTLEWLAHHASAQERARIARYTGRQSSDAETVWDLIELAMASRAAIAVIPMQDVLTLGEESRINDPSRPDGNWRWRWDPELAPAGPAFDRLGRLCQKLGRASDISPP